MFFSKEKLRSRIEELAEYRYRDKRHFQTFDKIEDNGEVGTKPPTIRGSNNKMAIGDCWTGRDKYLWLQTQSLIPHDWSGKKVLGLFDFGRTGSCHNSGFESLLYLNGTPYQGVDSNHQEVFISDELVGTEVSFQFRLWSGLEGGGKPVLQEHKIKKACITWLDEPTDDLYFTGLSLIDTVTELDENQSEYFKIIQLLDQSFLLIDWAYPGSENFYRSVKEANDRLQSELGKVEKNHAVTVRCIGHTHIDVAWLWRLKHTREKCARSFSTVLRLMEQYPEYKFLQTQPQLYEYIKEDYPEIYENIKLLIYEGKWEVDGGMWLEADCNLTSGESLVRQLLFGTRFIEKEFNKQCNYLWLPDVFGYSWALPQILKKSGIDTFMTTKISWNQYNRMPHDTFIWKGIDGTEILSHFITTPYAHADLGWRYDYNGHILPKTVKGIWDQYRDKSVNQEMLLSYGFGDGGGGVNREMLEMRRRLDKIPGLPHVKTGRADEYFKNLHETVSQTDQYVHTWDGELYLEYHRGTYTSQAENKKSNRKLELAYREVEWLSVMDSLLKSDWGTYPQQYLNEGWKIVLRNQFHDIIPGSSIAEVYEDSKEDYAKANDIIREVRMEKTMNLCQENEKKDFLVFNSSPWQCNDVVRIPSDDLLQGGSFIDSSGETLVAQKMNNEWFIKALVPPMGWTTISYVQEKNKVEESPFNEVPNGLKTPFYELEWNNEGHLIKMYDLEAQRNILQDGMAANVLQVFEDKPLRWDAWDIDIFYQQKMQEVNQLVSVSVREVGPLAAAVDFEWEYMNSVLKQTMIVYATNKRIDFVTDIMWREQQKLLKVAFPVDVRTTEATYDIQFGNVKRPTHWNTSWDYARFESMGQQWVDLSEQSYGVSLLNDCKYGYDIKDSVIRLSLIKAAIYPDVNQDIGKHTFTYSLYPHEGQWLEGKTVNEAWSLNNPLTFGEGTASKKEFSLFRTNADNVMIDTVKKAEDENKVLLRVHDFSGGRQQVRIESDLSIVSWAECNLLEREADATNTENDLQFELRPYEIKTFLVEMSI
ncbi:alpha-mannosidase [Alteribacter aurantiacus]|uniref:alpha-mannosidase n=1 Tax=Alteribacter aurantiacus TaxID=254410 RepID=UPI0004014C2A|nr:alpha-mannosidase [Alteribacter aurantiacus]